MTAGPFPAGQSFIYAIESEGQDTTDDWAEISQQGHPDYTRGNLIGTIPVAHMQKYTGPESGFEQTEEEADDVETLAIGHCGVTEKDNTPRNLNLSAESLLSSVGGCLP